MTDQVRAQLIARNPPALADLHPGQPDGRITTREQTANVPRLQPQHARDVGHAEHVAIAAQHRVGPHHQRCCLVHPPSVTEQ